MLSEFLKIVIYKKIRSINLEFLNYNEICQANYENSHNENLYIRNELINLQLMFFISLKKFVSYHDKKTT